ncbi:recombination regulator RecX [Microbacteriaceae bacterium 4G12]
MTIITKIQVQKHTKERYNIYINKGAGEEYGFSVDEHILIKYGLKKGMEIDELELSAILYEEEVRKAYLLAISYLSYQMRTKYEIEQYLKKKEVGQAVAAEAIAKLIQEKYINDQEYALAYVRTQKNVSLKGPTVIKRELSLKGIQDDVITNSLHEYSKEKQITNAVQLCEKKKKSYKNLSSLQAKQKLEEMLMRKGYTRDVISICLEELEDEQNVDQQWEALLYHGDKYHEKYKKYDGWTYEMKMKQALYRKGFSLEEIEKFLQDKQEE